MSLDFGDLKNIMRKFDHKMIVTDGDKTFMDPSIFEPEGVVVIKGRGPSVENVAIHVLDETVRQIREKFPDRNITYDIEVTITETENNIFIVDRQVIVSADIEGNYRSKRSPSISTRPDASWRRVLGVGHEEQGMDLVERRMRGARGRHRPHVVEPHRDVARRRVGVDRAQLQRCALAGALPAGAVLHQQPHRLVGARPEARARGGGDRRHLLRHDSRELARAFTLTQLIRELQRPRLPRAS